MQQSIILLCTGEEQPENGIKETILVSTASRRIKYLNQKQNQKKKKITKEVQSLCSENYQTLLKESIEDLNNGKQSVFTDQKIYCP